MRRAVTEVAKEVNALEMQGIPLTFRKKQELLYNQDVLNGKISVEEAYKKMLSTKTVTSFLTEKPSASLPELQTSAEPEQTSTQDTTILKSPEPVKENADLNESVQMKYGGSLPDLPKYQDGTPEILTDKNEYERRNRAYQAYSDSLAAYNNQKEIFDLAQRSNWSSGSGRANRTPLFNPLGLPIDTYERAYSASVPLNQIVGGLPYSGRDQYENIKPAGYLNQYDTQSGNAVKIFPFYKKPVQPVQPVIYRKPEPTMAIPRMEVEEKPEWFKQKRMIERMREYKKPEQPKRKYTATLQGVQGLQ